MSRITGAAGGAAPAGRGQSEVLGVVLLLGAVIVGALLTVAIGGMALQGVQDTSEGTLAQNTAQQAHSVLSEAASTGETRSLPVGDGAVDARVVDGGTLRVSMHDGADACGQRVTEEIGALRYTGGDRTLIYEGGAIWERSQGGLSIERAPPISHSEAVTRISVLSVSAAATNDGGDLVAQPNATARRDVARQVERLLTQCPASGYTDLQIEVSSPNADGWEEHFREAVDTTSNVTVTRSGDTVVATIENATDARSLGGLGLQAVDAPTTLQPGESYTARAAVANEAFDATDATVEFAVDDTGIVRSDTSNVSAFGVERSNFTLASSTINATLTQGTTYDYTVSVVDDSGATVDRRNGSFTYGTNAAMVELASVNDSLTASDDQLTVAATLQNYGLQNGTGAVTFDLTDPAVALPPQSSGPVDVAGGGATTVGFDLDVSALAVGHYDYAVEGPNRTITDSFTISNRSTGGVLAGDLRLLDVNATGTWITTGSSFQTSLTVANVANRTTSGTVALDVDGLAPVTRNVTLAPGATQTLDLTADAETIATLAVGSTHQYDVDVTSGGETDGAGGAFYLAESGGADLGVDAVDATTTDGTMTVNATLSNDGMANGTDLATLSLENADGQPVSFTTTPQQAVTTRWGGTSTATFELEVGSLGGNYTASVAYGGESASDVVTLQAINDSDGGVTIGGGGTGTVTVLGTEISGEWAGRGHWTKQWAPTSVTVDRVTNGEELDHQFQNDGADVEDPRNLNSYDTQESTYSHTWNQDPGDSTSITIQSTWWGPAGGHHEVNERYEHGRQWEDRQPRHGLGWIERRVDASANQNAENVRVLTDGDQVPSVSGVLPDQRNATEVLNQGAADRIDPDTGKLTLDPNEAVFLFEMTETTDDVPGDMWEYALNNEVSDPDYNDVIALVEFEPAGNGTVPVEMNVTDDGSGLVIGTPPVTSPGGGSVSVGGVDATPSDGADPGHEPDTPVTGVGEPTPPEDVDVQVDVVQIG